MNGSDSTPLHRQGMDYGESEDVQKVHAAIQREKQEPRVGLEPLSLWLIGIYALAVFFGGAYLGRFSGSFSGESLIQAPCRPNRPGPAPVAGASRRRRSFPRRSVARKVLCSISRVALKRA